MLVGLKVVHQVEASRRKLATPESSKTQTKLQDYQKDTPKSNLSKPFVKQRLEETVLDLICLDGEPISMTSKIGFHLACQQWCPGVTPPDRFKLLRLLKKKIDGQVFLHNQQILQRLEKGQLSLQIDFWSSRAQEHIFGVTGKFLDENWNLQTLTLAFRKVTGIISYDVVKAKVQQVLSSYGISEEKISTIMADGGSNICKAYKEEQTVYEILDDETYEPEPDETDSDSDSETSDSADDSSDENETEVEIGLTDSNYPTLLFSPTEEQTGLTRKHCLCHVLNLIVNDAVKKIDKNSPLDLTLARAKKVINHFKHSNNSQDKLRQRTKGGGLRMPVVTRWNSLLLALERLTDVSQIDYSIFWQMS